MAVSSLDVLAGHASGSKALEEMPPELQRLRELIREDMTQLLKSKLGDPALECVSQSSKVHKQLSMSSVSEAELPSASQSLAVGLLSNDAGQVRATRASRMLQSIYRKIRESRDKYDHLEDETTKLINEAESLTTAGGAMYRLMECFRWLSSMEEPLREGCLADVCRGNWFNGFFTGLILLNAVFMVVQVNQGIASASGPQPDLDLIDNVFVGLFFVELAVKLIVHRLYFFWCPDVQWNILDFGLVSYGVTDIVMHYVEGARGSSPTWMRSLRLFRVAKVLRILRVVRIFKQLDLIMKCLMGSFTALLWSVLMLFIMYYVFSLTLAQQTVSYLSENDGSKDVQTPEGFESVQSIMWALWITTFGADGWDLYFPTISQLGFTAQAVWVFYVVFTQIAVMNILTGIFVESALALADGTAQEKAQEHELQVMEDAVELRKLCEQHDTSGTHGFDGKLTRQEFGELLKSHEFTTYLHYIGMDTTHIQDLFDVIIADEDGNYEEGVDVGTIVSGILQLKGFARSSDLILLMQEIQRLEEQNAKSSRTIASELAGLRKYLEERNLND